VKLCPINRSGPTIFETWCSFFKCVKRWVIILHFYSLYTATHDKACSNKQVLCVIFLNFVKKLNGAHVMTHDNAVEMSGESSRVSSQALEGLTETCGGDAITSVCLTFVLSVYRNRIYCRSNLPISLKLGVMIGGLATTRKNWLTVDGVPVRETGPGSLFHSPHHCGF